MPKANFSIPTAASLQQESLDAPQLGFQIFRARPTNLVIEKPLFATPDMTGQSYLRQVLDHTADAPVVDGTQPLDVLWEVVLKATGTKLDARMATHEVDGVTVYELTPAEGDVSIGRLLISLDSFSLATADALGLSDDDTLILRGAQLENNREHVKLLTKLPRRFRVRTPVGEYSPDWAIVYNEIGSTSSAKPRIPATSTGMKRCAYASLSATSTPHLLVRSNIITRPTNTDCWLTDLLMVRKEVSHDPILPALVG